MSSSFENELIRARSPLPISDNEIEEINVNGQRGYLLNRNEIQNWPGSLNEYEINQDENPERIVKTIHTPVKYPQNVYLKYLKPPNPPRHGDLIIKQEDDYVKPPAPPIIIRQHASRPVTPEPLIIREKPPQKPLILPEEIVTIPGRIIEAQPRRVIIEQMPDLPAKPQPVIIEKWLPYEPQRRRIIFHPGRRVYQPNEPVKNLIIHWKVPNCVVEKHVQCLGVETADPDNYMQRHVITGSHEMLPIMKEVPDCVCYNKCNLQRKPSLIFEGDVRSLNLLETNVKEKIGIRRHGSVKSINYRPSLNGSFLVVLKRDPVSGDFGMVIRGGRDFNMSLYVLRLVCESPAQQDGRLQAGDEILEINGQPTRNLRLLEAVNLIRSRNTVSLIVRRSGMPPPTVADVMKAASML